LPLPWTEEALEHVSGRIAAVQDRLGRRLLIENVSSYVAFAHSGLTEWDFLGELARRTCCGILLDVNNVFVTGTNLGFDPREFLAGLPVEAVAQMHLAGHSRRGRLLIDTHDHPVCTEVWSLYAEAVHRFGSVPTILERDDRIPPLAVLMEEVATAEATLERQLPVPACSPVAPPRVSVGTSSRSAAPEVDLEKLERWTRWVVTDPRGVDSALGGQPGSQRAAEPQPRQFEAFWGDDAGTPEERLSVYADGYFERLHEALAADYPAVRRVLGEAAFRMLAAEYLLLHPSHAPSLALLGAELPTFLSSSSWRVARPFLPDLARLERAFLRALLSDVRDFGSCGENSLNFSGAAQVPLTGSLSLLDSNFPVLGLWRDRHLPPSEGTQGVNRPQRQLLAVFRTDLGAGVQRLAVGQCTLLAELQAGGTLEAACRRLETLKSAPTAEQVSRWFTDWVRSRMIVGPIGKGAAGSLNGAESSSIVA
jgi:hypothetical protein